MKLVTTTLASIVLVLTLIQGNPAKVWADGEESAPDSPAEVVATPGSDASFDKRLPPVFPGERMRDNGRDIRVWSSAGPVPVSSPPEAPLPFAEKKPVDSHQLLGGVIVDQRD